MAQDVQIDHVDLMLAQSEANKLKESIDSTYDKCRVLISMVELSGWEGKPRDSFLAYMELIVQYHAELKEAAKLQKNALDNLTDYYDDFHQQGLVKEVKNL